MVGRPRPERPDPLPAWILAIDFGTSYTVAASKIGDRPPEVIEVAGERRMPSVVMIDTGGAVLVGRTADDLSGTHPGSTLRALKNRLGDQAPVVLDGRPYQVVNLVAALLRNVYVESVRQMGEPPSEVRLTHPATWNRPRLNRLLEAAAKAELVNPALVPEPVAAALSFASEVGVANGAHVAVYDLGGGTFDTAVVTSSGGGFNIVGRPSGDQNIGGELFDEIISNHLGEQLPPDAWEAIQIGDEPLWQQVGATLRNEARKAKETLSGNPYADLIVPLPTGLQQIRLTRTEFEDLVQPYVAETVVLLDRCVMEAGLQAEELAGISLVGGSSRSPIVERLVKDAFPTVPVIRRGDPKTAVAAGAARAVRSSLSPTPIAGRGSTQEAAPGTAPQGIRLAPPVSQPPVAPSIASLPVSLPPAPTSSMPPAPTRSVPPAPRPAPPPAIAPVPAPAFTASVPATSSRKKLMIVLGTVLLVVAGAVVFLVARGDKSAKGLPSRPALAGALLPIRLVRSTLSNDWNEQKLTSDGDPFCPQFELAVPIREGEKSFAVSTKDSASGFDEDIAAYKDEASASSAFQQDTAIGENCQKTDGHVGGVAVTYTISDASAIAKPLGSGVIAIKYIGRKTGGPDTVLFTGLIIEKQFGLVKVQTNSYIINGDFSKVVDDYVMLTKLAFDRAKSEL